MKKWPALVARLSQWIDRCLVWPARLPEVADREVSEILLAIPESTPSLSELGRRAEGDHRLVMEHNDALDRKLTTMITAATTFVVVLAGTLVIQRWVAPLVGVAALVLAGMSIATSLYGLSPRAFVIQDLTWLTEVGVEADPRMVSWLLLHQDLRGFGQGRRVVAVKAAALRRAGLSLFLATLLTIGSVITAGGLR